MGELGEMKILLQPDAKPSKQQPYRMNPKYKERVKVELNWMLDARIIEPIDLSEWIIPIVIQDKKKVGEVRSYVDLRNMNDACLHDPFQTPFTYELLESFRGQEMYSFIDGLLGYHQV